MQRCVLLNPHARGGRAISLLPLLQAALPPDAVLHAPRDLVEALALLEALPEGSRVVAVGGDGTLNRWLPALLTRRLELGLVPMGSGNDVARSLGMHRRKPLAALVHALNAETRPMDVGCAQWRDPTGRECRAVFLSSFTAGFDSAVVMRTLTGPHWLRGRPRYLWATLVELMHLQTWTLEITANGKPLHKGPALFASSLNTPTFGSGMPATPAARTNDGLLNLLLAGPFGRLGALAMLPRLLTGTHLGHPRISTRAFETMTLNSHTDLPLAADGEFLGHARLLELSVLPGALRVVSVGA
ncbi:MAG: diacylglycerol kinase family protein [Hydrogenophaga sp.]|uniref:diacylglycerol/lipid kinase family protein n=1 Tax=Hydrogenophaga sp. TaxID=1904254 RepID=UPI002603C140|nr:diacylglycerol kinase family protein [Hydrogenophaga sp.]MDM7943872.1 diacylglycerol kinase family protein [Hydrogenophaga sp.]